MVMLYEFGQDEFVYKCNSCKSHIETRYHCDDFDLCIQCSEKQCHPHKMKKLGLNLDNGSSPCDETKGNLRDARKLWNQRCIQSLVHICQCRDANCRLTSCYKMKRVVTHTKVCKRKTNGCPICKQLIAICCYHAKHYQESKCPVPFCSYIKLKCLQQMKLCRRRRLAVMNTHTVAHTNPMFSGNMPLTSAIQSVYELGAVRPAGSIRSVNVGSFGGSPMQTSHQARICSKPDTQTPPAC